MHQHHTMAKHVYAMRHSASARDLIRLTLWKRLLPSSRFSSTCRAGCRRALLLPRTEVSSSS